MTATCKTEHLSVAEYKTMKGPVFVQVAHRGVSVCCEVKAFARGSQSELFVVDSPFFGLRTVPARLVRKCSGVDGHCSCAKETPQ